MSNEITSNSTEFQQLNLEEQHNLVGAFVWLLEKDKQQNPEHYQPNKKRND